MNEDKQNIKENNNAVKAQANAIINMIQDELHTSFVRNELDSSLALPVWNKADVSQEHGGYHEEDDKDVMEAILALRDNFIGVGATVGMLVSTTNKIEGEDKLDATMVAASSIASVIADAYTQGIIDAYNIKEGQYGGEESFEIRINRYAPELNKGEES